MADTLMRMSGCRVGHKRAHSATGFEQAIPFKVGINFGDGIGVDAKLNSQLPDRGELGARWQAAGSDCRPDSAFYL